MNDLKLLDELWTTPEPLSDGARADARAELMARTGARAAGPSPRRRVRLAAVGGFAVAATAALLVIQNVNGPTRSVVPDIPTAKAEVLERAAQAAEEKPFTPPRDDQWIYIEDRFSGSESPCVAGRPGCDGQTRRMWRRADGGAFAFEGDGGTLHVEEAPDKVREGRPTPMVGPLAGYHRLASLPTDPDELLRVAYGEARNIEGVGLTEDGDVYAIFTSILRDNLLPPELEAAVFRALKDVPGVSMRTIEADGRPAIAFSQTEDWLEEELLLDPKTYAYLGERSTVVRDAVINPEKAGNASGEIKKGHKVVVTRVASAIVNEAGERP